MTSENSDKSYRANASQFYIAGELCRRGSLEAANERLATLREHVESEIEAINSIEILDGEIELPEIELPEAQDNSDDAPTPLIDSAWSLYNQISQLKASKQYKGSAEA